MADERYIREYNGKIIGIIETESNGDQVARSFPTRNILGYYRKNEDHTTDFVGRILNHGNTIVELIYQDNAQRR